MGQRSEKSRIASKLKRLEKRLISLGKQEASARARWTREYHAYQRYIDEYTGLKNVATKRAEWLRGKIHGWPDKSVVLTLKRDRLRNKIKQTEEEIVALRSRLVLLNQEAIAHQSMHDEIVAQVFALSVALSQAYEARDQYLSAHVFPYLIDSQGKLRRQITFINSAQTRKITAMVNSISFLDPALAGEAQQEIERFFERFHSTEMDEATYALYELTQKLLSEKRTFKVGETLYRFLTMKLTKKDFPELVRAQELLKSALRSEKTNSYVRIYKRPTPKDRWKQIKIG